MSQESLIDDVTSWSQETCKQRLSEALPQLIAQYSNGASAARKVDILRTMVVSLLPIIDADERNQQFLAPVMSQTRVLFGSICSTILSTLQETDASQELLVRLHQSLKLLVEIINSLESCIQQVMPSRGQAVAMDTIESLPCNVLAVIKRSFGHCKESHSFYGDHFPAVSEQLSIVFKRAYSLQKALMALLEVISDSGSHGDGLSLVCGDFHELCSIISGMDTTLLISTWRFLVKLVSKHKDALHNSFQAAPLVTSLCSEMESHYSHALQLAPRPPSESGGSQGVDEKAFARTLKVCSLCFKMLHHMVKEFAEECLEHCGPRVVEVLLILQSLIPPSLAAESLSEGALVDLQRSVLVGIEPLIQLFVSSRSFCETLLGTNKDQPSDQSLSRLMTLLTVLKLLPLATDDARTLWLDPVLFPEDEPRQDLLSGVFTAVKQCYVELNIPITLPGTMCNGKPQHDVSLYEHVVTRLCGFTATVSGRLFPIVENCLLRNVMSGNWSCVMVAIDVWCFVARYSSAELCACHVRLLFDLVTAHPTNESPALRHLCLLLQRLLPLMASQHQLELLSAYPVEQHADLWSQLPLASLPDSSRDMVCEKIIKISTNAMNSWTESSDKRNTSSAEQLILGIHCVQRLYACNDLNQPITASLSLPLGTALANLCSILSLDKLSADVSGCLLDLSAHLLQHLEPVHISMLLKSASTLLTNDSPLTFRLACVGFLRRLAKKTLPQSPEQSSILGHIPVLFGKVLSDPNDIIHQQALDAFSTFAEETSHESVVPECLTEENVQTRVVDYLNQIPAHADQLLERSEVQLLRGQAGRLQNAYERLTRQALTEAKSASGRGEILCTQKSSFSKEEKTLPDSKRHCHDFEDRYHEAATKLKEALSRLKELKDVPSKIPAWLTAELSDARESIDELMDVS